MPVARSGARRGRGAKQQPHQQEKPNSTNPIIDNEEAAIATRTRRRRAAAAAPPQGNDGDGVFRPVNENVVAAAVAPAEVRGEEDRVLAEPPRGKEEEEEEEVGEKAMDDSGDKGHAGEDEGSTPPIPQKVRLFF